MEISEDLRDRVAVAIRPYQHLLIDLVEDRMPFAEFERLYSDIYRHDDTDFDDDVFAIVDRFFFDVDALVVDPVARPHVIGAIGPEELRACARELLRHAGYEVSPARTG